MNIHSFSSRLIGRGYVGRPDYSTSIAPSSHIAYCLLSRIAAPLIDQLDVFFSSLLHVSEVASDNSKLARYTLFEIPKAVVKSCDRLGWVLE